MVRARHHHHRQVLRLRPGQHVREQHGAIHFAVDHDRVGGHRRRLEMLHGDSDQCHALRLHALRQPGLHRGAERKSGEHGFISPGKFENGGQVFQFAAPLVVFFPRSRRRRGNWAARPRSRVRRRRAPASARPCCPGCRRRADADARQVPRRAQRVPPARPPRTRFFPPAPRSARAGGGRHQMRSRSTTRPCRRCCSMISSMSARST